MNKISEITGDIKICIHRGANQIGGSCVEIECEGQRLIIDVGTPLDIENEEDIDESVLPDIKGIKESDSSIIGILISHPHKDHYGLIKYVSPEIPVYIGKKADEIIETFSLFVPKYAINIQNKKYFESGESFVLGKTSHGDIRVTPFLVDHSAFDSYSFLIEIGGKKILYSGDFRCHGRKGKLSENLSKNNLLKNLDIVLLEGSSLSRLDENSQFPKEEEIEDKFVEELKKTKGLAIVHCSSQNIDRLVSVYHACCRTGRKMIVDLYQACVLRACFEMERPLFKNAALYVPENQRVFIKEKQLFDLMHEYSKPRIYRENILKNMEKFALIFRATHIRDFNYAPELLKNARFFYSMWNGYWNDECKNYKQVRDFVRKNNLEKIDIHTSGHASIIDLKKYIENLGSPLVTPIHTFHPEKFPDFFKNVKIHQDGEWFTV